MDEQPNLSYIHQLSGGDKAFEARLMEVVKRELPEESQTWRDNISSGNLDDAASSVHKLKHKISILGLEESYRFAETYEDELREGFNIRQEEFEKLLQLMLSFVKRT
ncbi:Hpt domain-containing protein [Christiangramia sabulilitoris]|uniref:Hpt domain-containing protein n=1 Tax=Christiangramia sabulilitoris TaxID=2583991 RepID=A0A550HX59_9FLAO|nr:Hpt domain-containing protein [Christiangramia sabulilitoris]TRO63342.1 Hpt domain-containing protein [Christiangramia sabulilitoris]